MKNLANCKPSEFFAQSVKIRKLAQDWLDVTKIFEIRKRFPEIPEDLSKEEKNKIIVGQMQKNFFDLFDSIFEKNAEKTLALLALLNFVEPEHVDDYEVADYLQSVSELISDQRVISFFTSLMQLGSKNI